MFNSKIYSIYSSIHFVDTEDFMPEKHELQE